MRQPGSASRAPSWREAEAGGGFEERWWNPINSPVSGPNGKVALIIHRAEDVTATKCTEAALRESEERFRLAADAVRISGPGYRHWSAGSAAVGTGWRKHQSGRRHLTSRRS
jgi:PAS domain-containing protein